MGHPVFKVDSVILGVSIWIVADRSIVIYTLLDGSSATNASFPLLILFGEGLRKGSGIGY